MSVELFRTTIPVSPFPVKISYNTGIVMLGSCFTENIGEKLHWYKFPVNINPFGIIYNPYSVKNSLERIMKCNSYSEDDLVLNNGLYFCFDHHSRFSDVNRDAALSQINEALTSTNQDLKKASFLIITLGTAFYYELKSSGQVVSNCHKLPDTNFSRNRMSVNDIVVAYKLMIDTIHNFNPDLNIIFTVSPIRHWKDGAHENQISKSTLLLAINELIIAYNKIYYFPAYELMLDELRDYRFYEQDMLHPNKVAIDFIWKRFMDGFMDRNTNSIMSEIEKIQLAKQHRPFNIGNENFQNFALQQLNKIDHISNLYPSIDLSSEYKYFRALIE
jgi:hypothetical protein